MAYSGLVVGVRLGMMCNLHLCNNLNKLSKLDLYFVEVGKLSLSKTPIIGYYFVKIVLPLIIIIDVSM